MAIESVTSATFAPPQPQARADQAAQAAQAEQSRQAAEARQQPEPTRQDNQTAENRPAQPVVNAQGQVTGKIINAIA
jgi:hypothetical protein